MFWMERLRNIPDAGPLMLQHMGDDVVAADEDAILFDLRLEVPVADMPGKPDEMLTVIACHFHQLFIRCNDRNEPSIFQHEAIAIGELHRPLEIDENLIAVLECNQFASDMALLCIEHHKIEG
jgi:hypothetical protein